MFCEQCQGKVCCALACALLWLGSSVPAGAQALTLPPVGAAFDYQLGGAYTPADYVRIVTRDRAEPPLSGRYNICYVNGFQTQTSEASLWLTQYPNLILRAADGAPVMDTQWDEMLLDIRTPENRSQIAAVVGAWIGECAAQGFNAVDIDNLDSYERSAGLILEQDAVAMLRLFSDRAHSLGLAVAQKNAPALVARRAELGSDFAVSEACDCFDECDVYTTGYGDHWLAIEYPAEQCSNGAAYTRARFSESCSRYTAKSRVFRDVQLVSSTDPAHTFVSCMDPAPVPSGGTFASLLLAVFILSTTLRKPVAR